MACLGPCRTCSLKLQITEVLEREPHWLRLSETVVRSYRKLKSVLNKVQSDKGARRPVRLTYGIVVVNFGEHENHGQANYKYVYLFHKAILFRFELGPMVWFCTENKTKQNKNILTPDYSDKLSTWISGCIQGGILSNHA